MIDHRRTAGEIAMIARVLTLSLSTLLVEGPKIGFADQPELEPRGACLQAANSTIAHNVQLYDSITRHASQFGPDEEEARRYFDQGMTFLYAFNHEQAVRSFYRAAQLAWKKKREACATCCWGAAYASGPNINRSIHIGVSNVDSYLTGLCESIEWVKSKADDIKSLEADLVDALWIRYDCSSANKEVREGLYSEMMREMADKFQSNDDIAVLYAEALMNKRPWHLWEDGKPAEDTNEILLFLRRVLERNPKHLGANHFYIHAIEASSSPQDGLESADRLQTEAKGLGHLLHMSSHIYAQMDRYPMASAANEQAILVDQKLFCNGSTLGRYCFSYYAHNLHFLVYSALMEGRCKRALEVARDLAKLVHKGQPAIQQWRTAASWFVLARSGEWQALLSELEKYSHTGPYLRAMHHFFAGLAYARQGNLSAAREMLQRFKSFEVVDSMKQLDEDNIHPAYNIQADKQRRIAEAILQAEIAGLEGRPNEQADFVNSAIEVQRDLAYKEPPVWLLPLQSLTDAAILSSDDWITPAGACGVDAR